MTPSEAVVIAQRCKPMAQWLMTNLPSSTALFDDEAETLPQFQEMLDAGYGDDPQILELANLSWVEFSFLEARLEYHLQRGEN